MNILPCCTLYTILLTCWTLSTLMVPLWRNGLKVSDAALIRPRSDSSASVSSLPSKPLLSLPDFARSILAICKHGDPLKFGFQVTFINWIGGMERVPSNGSWLSRKTFEQWTRISKGKCLGMKNREGSNNSNDSFEVWYVWIKGRSECVNYWRELCSI